MSATHRHPTHRHPITRATRRRRHPRAATVAVLALTAAILALPGAVANGWTPFDPHGSDPLRDAWRAATEIGRYDFETVAVETIHPMPGIRSAGRRPHTQRVTLEGRIDRPAGELALRLRDPIVTGGRVLEIEVSHGRARSREGDGPWRELTGLEAAELTGHSVDPLGPLAALRDVRRIDGAVVEAIAETAAGASAGFPTSAGAPDAAATGARSSPGTRLSPDTRPSPDTPDSAPPADASPALERYAFTVHGPTYAEHLRDEMQAELRRSGELPAGMSLDSQRMYRDMEADGEIWIDGRGLPVRQILRMRFPAERGADSRVDATIVTEFRGWAVDGRAAALAAALRPLRAGAHRLGAALEHPVGGFGAPIAAAFALALLLHAVVTRRRSRAFQRGIAIAVSVSIVAGPFVHSWDARAFHTRVAAAAEGIGGGSGAGIGSGVGVIEGRQGPSSPPNAAGAWLDERPFDPHRDPLATDLEIAERAARRSDGPTGARVEASVAAESATRSTAAREGAASLRISTGDGRAIPTGDGRAIAPAARVAAEPAASTGCTVGGQADTDCDGLSDVAEITRLGTDPEDVDSDGDLISDGAEVAGFLDAGGQRWYLDPTSPDSNDDGLLDGLECPELVDVDPETGLVTAAGTACGNLDGDAVPDVYDFDNDGDGVPDGVDSAPSFAGANETRGRLSLDVDGHEPGRTLLVDFEIVPEERDHLWLAENVLDWPTGDSRGQIRRLTDTTFADVITGTLGPSAADGDMLVSPRLEIRIPAPSSNAANPSGGLPVSPDFAGDVTGETIDAWLDTEALDVYGVEANQGADGDILVYVPLAAVEDEVGGARVAFGGRMPYFPTVWDWGLAHEARLTWLVTALVDTCDTSDFDKDRYTYDEWCSLPENVSTATQVIQQYHEDFQLSGLSVREDRGTEAALVGQHVSGTAIDARLWHLAGGLSGAFLEAQAIDDDMDGSGDRRFGAGDIARFDSASSLPDGDARRWGIPKAALSVSTVSGADESVVVEALASTTIPAMLADLYGEPTTPLTPTLLLARETHVRATGLQDTAAVSLTSSGDELGLSVDLTGVLTDAYASLSLSPFTHDGVGWTAAATTEAIAGVAANLGSIVTADDLAVALDVDGFQIDALAEAGAISVAQSFYAAMQVGTTRLVETSGESVGGALLVDADYALDATDTEAEATVVLQMVAETVAAIQQASQQALAASVDGTVVANAFDDTFDEPDEIIEQLGYTFAPELALDVDGKNLYSAGKVGAMAMKELLKRVEGIKAVGNTASVKWLGRAAKAMVITSVAVTYILVQRGTLSVSGAEWVLEGTRVASKIVSIISAADSLQKVAKVAQNAATNVQRFQTVANTQYVNTAGAAVAFVIGASIAVGLMIYTIYAVGIEVGSLAFDALLARTIVNILVTLMYAIISATLIGALIIAIIGLIDGVIALLCKAAKVEEGSDVDTWVCGGITGVITEVLVRVISDQYVVLDLEDKDRLQMGISDPTIIPTSGVDGFVTGNELGLTMVVTSTIKRAKATGAGSELEEAFGRDLGEVLRRTNVTYTLQTSKHDIHGDLEAGGLDWPDKTEIFTLTEAATFPEPGIDQAVELYLSEGLYVPALSCWGFGIQACERKDFTVSNHIDLGRSFVQDILPASFDDFYELARVVTDSYRLAWDDRFPILADADGDGLLSASAGGADPDDGTWDTDGDGLPDPYELAVGMDAESADGDGDGLSDYWEVLYGTNPLRADTDGDGLGDGEERLHSRMTSPYVDETLPWTGGWTIVYDRATGTALETLVSADPLTADRDVDSILDDRERIYGYNPNLPSALNVLSLSSSVDREHVAPGASVAYTATVGNALDNRVADGLLQVELPVDVVRSTRVMDSLQPQDVVTMTGAVAAPVVTTTEVTSLTVRAGAVIRDPSTGRVLWLHFNESGTKTSYEDDAASAGGPHDATCVSGSCPSGDGASVDFDAAEMITVADDDELDLPAFTLSTWLLPESGGVSPQRIIGKGAAFDLRRVGNAVRLDVAGADCATGVQLSTQAGVLSNLWSSITATYDGETVRLYRNGAEEDSASLPAACLNDDDIEIGQGFSGRLDELQLYPRALLPAEVAALYKQPVFSLSSYESDPDPGYLASDESDYGSTPIFCSENVNYAKCPVALDDAISGSGFDFDESHSFDVLGNLTRAPTELGANDNTFAMSMWIRPDRDYTPDNAHLDTFGQMVLGYTVDGFEKAYPSLYVRGDRLKVRFGHADAGGYCEAESDEILTADAWQHIAVVFDGNAFSAYVNGELADGFAGAGCAGEDLYQDGDFVIGNGLNSAIYFDELTNVDGTNNGEGFIWSLDNDYDNGIGPVSLVWDSGENNIDRDDTLSIDTWQYSIDRENGFAFCDRDSAHPATSCELIDNANKYLFRDDGTGLVEYEHNFPDGFFTHAALNPGAKTAPFTRSALYDLDITYNLYSTGFDGALDEIALYRTALDAGDVERIYNASLRSVELHFDEAPGADILADATANGHDGTCAGESCPDTGIPGRRNQAARFDGGLPDDDGFDGVADFVTLPSGDALGLVGDDFTVMAWVKLDAVTSGHQAVLGDTNASPSGSDSLRLSLFDGRPHMALGSGVTSLASQVLTPDRWYHLAWRYNASAQQQRVYLDGVQVAVTAAGSVPPYAGTGPILVGRARGGSAFDGHVDELVIVKSAIGQAEILRVIAESPHLNLHLDEDLVTTSFRDDSPHALAATCGAVGVDCPGAGDKGQMREAAVFDGDDRLQVADSAALDLDDFGISMWVRPSDTTPGEQELVRKGLTGGSALNYRLALTPDDTTLRFSIDMVTTSASDPRLTITSSNALQPLVWNHVAATYDPDVLRMRLYVNGQLDAELQHAQTTEDPAQNAEPLLIGDGFAGGIDELAIFGDAPSPGEIEALYDYQAAWFDVKDEHRIVIDADDPSVRIALGTAALPLAPTVVGLVAMDAGSSIDGIDVDVTAPDTSVTSVAADTAGDGSWSFLFAPASAGLYTFDATVTDAVGHTGTDRATVLVDDTGPTAALDPSLLGAVVAVTDTASLFGTLHDGGGGGVYTGTVALELLDRAGASVNGFVAAEADATSWSAGTPFLSAPYGSYDARLYVEDLAGNAVTPTLGTVMLDGRGPFGDVARSGFEIREASPVITGTVSDAIEPFNAQVLRLHFEEPAGSTTFVGSSRNHLTAACTACPTAGVDGPFGAALDFGGDDVLHVGPDARLAPTAATWAAWIRPEWTPGGLGYDPALFSMAEGATLRMAIRVDDDLGGVSVETPAGTLALTGTLAADSWQHLAIAVDTEGWTAYVDGVPGATISHTHGSAIDLPLSVGADGSGSGFFVGGLDEVAVYERALSADELFAIANPLPTGIASAEVRYRAYDDRDQAEDEGTWHELSLTPAGTSFATWSHALPDALDGLYKVDLNVVDGAGNERFVPGVWTGEVLKDSDGDGLLDRDEIDIYGTDPLDPDSDDDGVIDGVDNCPLSPNPLQTDTDGDGQGDACDPDDDDDGVIDAVDNCPLVANAGQADYDGDGAGDACDPDDDGDGVDDDDDAYPMGSLLGTVVVEGCDSGVPNHGFADGSSFNDLIAQCAIDNPSPHGKFVKCVSHLTNAWKRAGLITGAQKGDIMSCIED